MQQSTANKQAPVHILTMRRINTVTHDCGHTIYDGEMIRSRCVNLREGTALCRCKAWVRVPIQPKYALSRP